MLLALVCGEEIHIDVNSANQAGFQHSLAMLAGVITVGRPSTQT